MSAPLDLEALARRAARIVADDPLVHLGATVLVAAGSTLSLGVLVGPLVVGYIHLARKALASEPLDFSDLRFGFTNLGPALLTWLVSFLAIAVGLVVFVVPGLCVGIAWMFGFWFVALRGQLSAQALKSSWRVVRREPGTCLVIALAGVLANVAGGLLVVGWLVSLPWTLVFLTLCFEALEPA